MFEDAEETIMAKSNATTTKKIKDVDQPTPTKQESTFNFDELFFSVTDPKSTITFANELFVRISRYEPQDIIGQLHKLIRHPDMPRAVFNIFWDYLQADKPVAAYIKNLAKDGSYYWVMALAFPCNGGFLSKRLKPGSPLFDKITHFYSQTLAYQQKQEQTIGKRKAMEKSREYLLGLLQEEGFANYDEFMWNALQQEMHHREDCLSDTGQSTAAQGEQQEAPPVLYELESVLRKLVMSLENLKNIHTSLVSHSDYILELARSILLLSLNAQIGSSKLHQEDIALSVIAEKMGSQSTHGEEKLLEMKENIQQLSDLIRKLNFDIISSKLQVEMTIDFLNNHSSRSNVSQASSLTSDQAVELLYEAFMPRLEVISEGIGQLPDYLKNLLADVNEIERLLLVLRFIHTTGKVEIARLQDNTGSFKTTFQNLIQEVETAQGHLDTLSDLVQKHEKTGIMYKDLKKKLKTFISTLNKNQPI